MKTLLTLIVLIVLAIAGISYWSKSHPAATEETPVQQDTNHDAMPGRYMDIESYVRTSISSLSPIKEQVGGTFQVTAIELHEGSGTVSYEDGHNAYTADFTYHVAEDGKPSVTSFDVRK
jgi:hypothetical protein